jgi:hypothetical protein
VPDDAYAALPWWRLVYDREIRIYENLEVLPRAFLVDRARVVSGREALATIVARDFDPRAGVLLEDTRSPALPPSPGGAPGEAEVRALSANRVVVRATATRPAYLVLSEVNYPGWRARVDGVEAPVYQADYLFRAVHLTPGAHDVVFTFMPFSYAAAVTASVAGLVAVAGCFVAGARRRSARAAS